jgi:ADP-ribose pyrophosphatase
VPSQVNTKNIMKFNTATNSKIISSKNVFKSKYFRIDNEKIERDGKVFTKDILKRTPTVIVLPINDKDEIYLVSQFRDSYQKVLLETIAGHIENGDSPLQSAKKELKEEAGLTAKQWRKLGSFMTSANIQDEVYVFCATGLTEGVATPDEDEDIEVVKISYSEALSKIENGEISVSSNVAAVLLLDKLRREGKVLL